LELSIFFISCSFTFLDSLFLAGSFLFFGLFFNHSRLNMKFSYAKLTMLLVAPVGIIQ